MAEKLLNKFKKFLDEKKTDKHFKKTGPGHSLSGGGPSAAPTHSQHVQQQQRQQNVRQQRPADKSQLAEAALSRIKGPPQQGMTRSQRVIQEQARRELEREKATARQDSDSLLNVQKHEIDEREFESAPLLTTVLYTCDLLGEDRPLTKASLQSELVEFLQMQLEVGDSDEAVGAAALMIHSLNAGRDKRQTCVDTLVKYLKNIAENPSEEKFRKIRCGNKALQERVLALTGGAEFLKAVGFTRQMMEVGESGNAEECFYLSAEEAEKRLPLLAQAIDTLTTTTPIALRLYRNPTVLSAKNVADTANYHLPDEFFDLTADEVRQEYEMQKALVDRMLTLRTREMRERDETMRRYRYKYTLIRIAMPDQLVLQGTFSTSEKLSAVREFVRTHLAMDLPFELCDTSTTLGADKDDKPLGELSLVPAALLRFQFDPEIQAQLRNQQVRYLKEETIAKYSSDM